MLVGLPARDGFQAAIILLFRELWRYSTAQMSGIVSAMMEASYGSIFESQRLLERSILSLKKTSFPPVDVPLNTVVGKTPLSLSANARRSNQTHPVLPASSVRGDIVWVQARAEERVKALLEADGQLTGQERTVANHSSSGR